MSGGALVESCVDSFEAAIASAAGGAARLELCAHLEVGGTTPDPALVSRVAASVPVPVMAMVRPRGGDFVYGSDEIERLLRDVAAMRAAGAHGLVFGALTGAGAIDMPLMRALVQAAGPLPVTCHRAFDEARDLEQALDALVELGVTRVLTSGGAPTAAEGTPALARLVARASGRIVVMAGGTVRAGNAGALVAATGITEVHARLIREPGPADAATRARWTADVAALVAAVA